MRGARAHINAMASLIPILMAVTVGLVMYRISAWRTSRMLDQQSTTMTDPTIGALVDRLSRALDLPKIPVHVYEVDVVNGLAAPDGRVFITRGFLNKYRYGEVSAEEITSVVAHELGHVALGHSQKRMLDFAGQNALRTMLMILFARFIPFIGAYIAQLVTQMIGARLSRNDEFEADAYAAALMTKAGLGVDAQVSLFEKLGRMGPQAQAPAWFLSHPKAEERIAAIRALETKWINAQGA